MSKIVYRWPGFKLVYDRTSGNATTWYGDRWSGCDPHADDAFHARKLDITDKMHRLEHELVHHLLGLRTQAALPEDQRVCLGALVGSPVIFRDAMHIPQPKREAELEEWAVTAVQYFMHEQLHDAGALHDLRKQGVNVIAVVDEVRALLALAEHDEQTGVVIETVR